MHSRTVCWVSLALFAVLTVGFVDGGAIKENNVMVVKNMVEFKKSHPELCLLPLRKETGKARSQSVRYTLGGRIAGDHLIAQAADINYYQVEKDATIQLTYPQSGTGSIVTYVEIVCEQASNDGNAYVTAGGIGQRSISIVLDASKTTFFSYNVQYFGSD
ncbi:uncharacterized protein [Eurosta solidaginis]|uniref:uncharacterized protein n=1 Tax=Eurosta solidaginis TaxID=178769 RepID=UPI00353129DC